MNILIADDDKIVLKLLEHILKADPEFKIRKASDGQECWEILESGFQPDVCLLDIEMPHLTGLELLEKMRAEDKYREIPVLIITSRTDINSKASAAALRSFAFVIKPFKPKKVMALVKEALTSSGREFEPDGFEQRDIVLQREKMDGTHYFKSMVYLVEMLGFRMESIEKHLTEQRPEQLSAAMQPLRKLASKIGGDILIDYFDKLQAICENVKDDYEVTARRHFRLLRSEYNGLKDALESYLNVVINSESTQRIVTQPDMTDWANESIRLSAEIEETNEDTEDGFSLGNQRIILRAFRGEDGLMTARLGIENGRIVLRSTLGREAAKVQEEFDLTVFPELQAEEAIEVVGDGSQN